MHEYLKRDINILYEGVLIIYRHAFYCAIINFYIPGQQNGTSLKVFMPDINENITCSELNMNDHVSPSPPVMRTGIRASLLRTISFHKIKLAEKLFSSLRA